MKLYYFAVDNGDGSVSIRWTTEENVKKVVEYADDGRDGWWFADESLAYITVPDGVDVGVSLYKFPDDDST